ncbi:hypothetical protein AAG570_003487 [Ranatra chinensis]|uniref:C2H2-type domain-containing protein n=1 Tax=Ranatra chinensis TaxID=642074 RepID=A0ABD0Y3R9_9HEMI
MFYKNKSQETTEIVLTALSCPEELTSANGLVATPIGVSGELQPPRVNQQVAAPHADDTSNIKDPIQRAVMDNIWGKLPTKTPIDKIRCDVCKVECIGKAIYTTHLNGSKHAKKLKELEIQKECASMPFVKQCKESNTYSCTLCNATLNAYSQIAAHVRGAKHQAKANSRDKLEESNAQINVHPGKPRHNSSHGSPFDNQVMSIAEDYQPKLVIPLNLEEVIRVR